MYAILAYIYHKFMVNVGNYSSPMEYLGLTDPASLAGVFKKSPISNFGFAASSMDVFRNR